MKYAIQVLYLALLFGLRLSSSGQPPTEEKVGVSEHWKVLNATHPHHCILTGDPSSKKIALTFDDGPTELTAKVLDTLEKYAAKATFFWLGQNILQHPHFVKNAAQTHQIANHSWDHKNGFKTAPATVLTTQIAPTNQRLISLGIKPATYYRPPFGAVTEKQIKYLAEHGITTVLWSLSTLDWDTERNSTNQIFSRFKEHIHNGAIVLLHDRTFNDDGQSMLNALSQILVYGQKAGYEFVTLNELLIK